LVASVGAVMVPPLKLTSGVTSVSVEPTLPETKPWLSSVVPSSSSPVPPASVPPPERSSTEPASLSTDEPESLIRGAPRATVLPS